MKLKEPNRRVARRHSSRSRPYDLRRKVLVNNFLKDQTPTRINPNNDLENDLKPTEEDPSEDLPKTNLDQNLNESINTTGSEEPESSNETNFDSDLDIENSSSNSIKSYSPETKEFLHLLSRRLKITDSTRKIKSESPHLTRSILKLQLQTSSSSSESDSAIQTQRSEKLKRTCRKLPNRLQRRNVSGRLHPLRSYPTFDRLNEIFQSNESKPLLDKFISKRINTHRGRVDSKAKRLALRKKISSKFRRMFKKLDVVSENSHSSSGSEDPEVETQTEEKTVSPNRRNSSHKLLDSVKNNNFTNQSEELLAHSNSFNVPTSPRSFSNLKTPRRRSDSFKLKKNVFTISAYRAGSLL